MVNRLWKIRAGSYDEASGTFDAVAVTETPVAMRDSLGPYGEILPMATLQMPPGSVPFIDSHALGSARATLGKAGAFRIEESELVTTIQLSDAEDVRPIRERIADGTLDSVSAGYLTPHGFDTDESQGYRIKRARAWTVFEVSVTAFPADKQARIRSFQQGGSVMTNPTPGGLPPAVAAPAAMPPAQPPAAPPVATPQASALDKPGIRSLARTFGLEGEAVDSILDKPGATTETAKAALLDAIGQRSAASPRITAHGPSMDDPDAIAAHMTDAMAFRMRGKRPEAKDGASRYFGLSMLDMADAWAGANGVQTRSMSRADLAQYALGRGERAGAMHSTSDFPKLVGDAINKVAAQQYEESRTPLTAIARTMLVPDFNETRAIAIGGAGMLQELNEAGEIVATTRPEAAQGIKLKTYAARIDLSRELIINDRLGLLGDSTREFAQMATRRENAQIVAALTSVANLDDGEPPFDDSRGNTTATENLTEDTLSTLRQAMRTRVGLDADSRINVDPRFLIVGPDRETAAEKLIAAITPAESDNVNPFAGRLSLIVESMLPVASHWYLAAAPSQLAALVIANLESAPGPQVERQDQWNTLGVSFRAYYDFAAGWADPRAIQRGEV